MTSDVKPEAPLLTPKSPAEFCKELKQRYLMHKCSADHQTRLFKPIGWMLGLLIPILAAVVTYSTTNGSSIAEFSTAIAVVLSVLTIISSVLKPEQRFIKAVQFAIALHDWKRDFDLRLARIDANDTKACYNVIEAMDQKLSQIGEKMAEGWMPKDQN